MQPSTQSADTATTRVYRPDSRFGAGLAGSLAALAGEIRKFRSHIGTLFWSEFHAGYRGTALGAFWNIALPMLPISVYILLVSLRVFPVYDGVPPSVYIGFNVTLWYLFTGLILQPMQVVKSRNAEVMKTAMPLSASIAASFARLCFDTLVRAAFVAVLMAATATAPMVSSLALLPILLAACALFLSLGLLLSIANVIFPDIERVVTIILQYGIFLSGVIFPLSSLGALAALETANPFNVFIAAARDVVFLGAASQPVALAAWAAASLLLVLFSARFFYVMEYRIRGVA